MKINQIMLIPVFLFIFSLFILYQNRQKTGNWIEKDVNLKGGFLITIESPEPIDTKRIESLLTKKYGSVFVSDRRTSTGYGVMIEIESMVAEDVVSTLKTSGIPIYSYSVGATEPLIEQEFLSQFRNALIISFILVGITTLLVYKKPILSLYIVSVLSADIIMTLAITSLLGIQMGFISFISLLIIVLYSIWTNLLLNDFFKTKKGAYEKTYRTTVALTLITTLTLLIISFIFEFRLLMNMMSILLIGFFSNAFFIWSLNKSMLERGK